MLTPGSERERVEAQPVVTVLVPTRNPGPGLVAVVDRLRAQRLDRPRELLVIDSGSSDGTAEWLRRQPDVRLIEIAAATFDHGLTRNIGIREARGEIVVLTVQDAVPADEEWLQHLVNCYDDARVAGAWSRQIVRPDANPFIRGRLDDGAAAGGERRVQEIGDVAGFDTLPPLEKLARIAFDNVSASVRRDVALTIPFRACRFGEDLDWSLRVLLAGYRIVYEPRSAVVHSHNRSMWYEFRRVYVDHQHLRRLLGVHTVPRLSDLALRSAGGTLRLMRTVATDPRLGFFARIGWWARALPFAFTQNLAQFLGARSVAGLSNGSRAYRRLDRVLSRGV